MGFFSNTKNIIAVFILFFSSIGLAETDPKYISKNAINSYWSTFDKSFIDKLTEYQIIMLGEVHGTSEYPRLVLELVRNLKSTGKRVTLALEIPANFQDEVNRAIKNNDLNQLLGTKFFQSEFQDGRSSLAMAILILAAGADADVLCFDKSWSIEAPDRDLEMARNVTKYVKDNPDRTMVLLAGNYHTRLVDEGDTPMGYYLSHIGENPIDRSKIFSILARSEKGAYWACHSNIPTECGVKRYENSSVNYAAANDWERYFLVEPALQDGHDASVFVRTTSASVTLKGELPLLNDCQLSSLQNDLLMDQEFWTFDQSPFGHRYFYTVSKRCGLASAKVTDRYISKHRATLLPNQFGILNFHAGQYYAFEDSYEVAVARFKNSLDKSEPENPDFHWNDYVFATISFLKKDKPSLLAAIQRYPSKPTGGDAINFMIVKRFLKCFDSSYTDAYGNKGTCVVADDEN